MKPWPITTIETHEADAVARFTSQYFDAVKLQGLAGIWARRIQALEDAVESVLKERWVPEAIGAQLDELGAIVGEARLGRTDAAYREAIEIRISINQSGGEPERIIEYLRRITGATSVIYGEIYPARIEVFIQNELTQSQRSNIKDLTPAAIGNIYITTTADDEVPYGYNETGQPAYNDRDGFGELGLYDLLLDDGDILAFDDGDTLALNDQQDPALPTEGGYLAELFEV